METVAHSVQPSSSAERQARPRPRRGRGRGQSNQTGQGRTDAALQFRPASVVPNSEGQLSHSLSEGGASRQLEGRGGRRGRGRGRGNAGRQVEDRVVNGRRFGGQLTSQMADVESVAGSTQLQGDAPAFVPGQNNQNAHPPRSRPQRPAQTAQPRIAAPKSAAPDIATRTHEDIDNGHYECAICTSEVRRKSKVWSCHTCWTVFHLQCVKEWSTSSLKQQQEQPRQDPTLAQWRCPGCNLSKDALPKSYACWCEKEYDPKPLPGLPPHSCGQTCGKERAKKCPHPCPSICHAGPCPPCAMMGPTQKCFCGRHESTKRCTETIYSSGWSCGEVCGSLLACGEHACLRPCHEGPCGTCQERLPARCYCGKMEKDILCGDRDAPALSQMTHKSDSSEVVVESWTGLFVCENACQRSFDCGVHHCTKTCHPQKEQPAHCPMAPGAVTHCTCGKTPLAEISDAERKTCQDPIPSCGKSCQKTLACGHLCPEICHSGDCPGCRKTVSISCQCGKVTSNSMCHQGTEEKPQCKRICRQNLNCGRHACEERCCSGERKAIERLANKRKQRPLNTHPRQLDEGFEAEHICTRQCGRPLKCGNHFCEELCHKGPCGTCKEAIFEEISCHCGRTVLMPPLPCGTQPPPCRHPCQRPKPCGHPQVAHNCHQDSESCPKCPFLVERRCMCGKKTLKNQQCWLNDVRCGEICGKKLRCGYHFCRKQCHRNGECEDAGEQACQQPCGKPKKACGHPDEAPCHAPYPCKEDKPCASKIFVTCDCQAQKQEMKCGASKHGEGNTAKTLLCNDECARLERNRKIAMALNIDQASHVDGGDHIPFSTETLDFFASNSKWCQTHEHDFRVFAVSDDEKRLRLKPMAAAQRAFIHSLAEDFGFDSESVDPEPHRHVLVWKTPRFVSAPNKTLIDALRLRKKLKRAANATANLSDSEGPSVNKLKTPSSAQEPPFNSFVIKNPRFALTLDEVRSEVNNVVAGPNPFAFDIEFLPSEEVVLKAVSGTLSSMELERVLQNIRAPLTRAIALRGFGSTQLCSTDNSLNILRLESDLTGGNGWSRVAAKKVASRINVPTNGFAATNSFAALGAGKVTFAKKKPVNGAKPKPELIVDDWEAAEQAEAERENPPVDDMIKNEGTDTHESFGHVQGGSEPFDENWEVLSKPADQEVKSVDD